MSYLRYLCMLAHSGVQYILCCIFVLFVFVLCTLCSQFLWIVHFLIAPSVFSNVYSQFTSVCFCHRVVFSLSTICALFPKLHLSLDFPCFIPTDFL